MQRASFRSELSAIQLDEGTNGSWIMALKHGTYQHPVFGEIPLTYDRAERFVLNERRKIRRTDMDIDFDHKAQRMDAAGWVKDVENRGGDVWYFVEWTDEAAQKIKSKQYRYFSAEFADQWTDAETGTTYNDVLFGGALTNRPFIKGMVPVNLSESEAVQARLAEEIPTSTGAGGATEGGAVDLTAVRTALKLSEGTSDEQVIEAVVAKLAEVPVAPAEAAPDLVQLAEGNPALQRVLAEAEESKRRLAEVEASLTLSEVNRQLAELDTADTAVTPAVKELAQPLLVKLPAKERGELLAVMRKFAEGQGTVKLGEAHLGATAPGTRADDGADPVKKFTDLVDTVQREEKLSYRDAVRVATARDTRLFDAYREATTAFKIGA